MDIAFVIYDGFTALDLPGGRHEVLLRPPRGPMGAAVIVGGMALALLALLALSPEQASKSASRRDAPR